MRVRIGGAPLGGGVRGELIFGDLLSFPVPQIARLDKVVFGGFGFLFRNYRVQHGFDIGAGLFEFVLQIV